MATGQQPDVKPGDLIAEGLRARAIAAIRSARLPWDEGSRPSTKVYTFDEACDFAGLLAEESAEAVACAVLAEVEKVFVEIYSRTALSTAEFHQIMRGVVCINTIRARAGLPPL